MLKPLDHLVLPVADLTVAEQRYASLGFTVAPRGQHPFGTINACVYFADDTFLEPLAVSEPGLAAEATRGGNTFVAHQQLYRTRAGEEGLSALVLGTTDAMADDALFQAEGISGGNRLDFSRPFTGADGTSGQASFRLAFASDLRAPDALFFTCERVGVPAVDRTPLCRHENGVQTISRVLLVAPEPHLFETLVSKIFGSEAVRADPSRISVQTKTAQVDVLDIAAASGLLGGRTWDTFDPTLQFAAVEFGVDDLSATSKMLRDNGVAFAPVTGGGICVAPALGQGVPFLFSEKSR